MEQKASWTNWVIVPWLLWMLWCSGGVASAATDVVARQGDANMVRHHEANVAACHAWLKKHVDMERRCKRWRIARVQPRRHHRSSSIRSWKRRCYDTLDHYFSTYPELIATLPGILYALATPIINISYIEYLLHVSRFSSPLVIAYTAGVEKLLKLELLQGFYFSVLSFAFGYYVLSDAAAALEPNIRIHSLCFVWVPVLITLWILLHYPYFHGLDNLGETIVEMGILVTGNVLLFALFLQGIEEMSLFAHRLHQDRLQLQNRIDEYKVAHRPVGKQGILDFLSHSMADHGSSIRLAMRKFDSLADGNADREEQCTICLENLEWNYSSDNDMPVFCFACSVGFHRGCLNDWQRHQTTLLAKATCPLHRGDCRKSAIHDMYVIEGIWRWLAKNKKK